MTEPPQISSHGYCCPTNLCSDLKFCTGYAKEIEILIDLESETVLESQDASENAYVKLQLLAPVRRAMGALPSSEKENRTTEREQKKLDRRILMARLLVEASGCLETDHESLIEECVAPEPTVEDPVTRSEVREMMGSTLTQAVNKLYARITQVTKYSMVGIKESLENDHNLTFIRGALKRPTREVLTSMMGDGELWEAFEAAVGKMRTSASMAKATKQSNKCSSQTNLKRRQWQNL